MKSDMNENLITVIIPVYNAESYLERCMDSIINNTYRNLEIICINDGSKDTSLAILNKYQERDERIKIINKQNQGVSAARNDGLKVANGYWIAFVDSDDWVHPQYFEILTAIAAKTNADIIASKYFRVKEYVGSEEVNLDLVTSSRVDLKTIYKSGNLKYFVWGKLYKKEVLSNHWFDENITYGEDAVFNLMIYCTMDQLAVINVDAKLYYYCDREGSAVNSIDRREWIRNCQTYIDIAKNTDNESIRAICVSIAYKRLLLGRYTEMYTNKRKEVICDCNKLLTNNLKYLLSVKNLSSKEKIIFALFTFVPQAYRSFRLIDDPTMRTWERNQKESQSSVYLQK